MREEWNGFVTGKWESEINVRDFIQKNYTPYDGDEEFLCGPTQDTKDLWAQVMELTKQELAEPHPGVLDMDTKIVSTITSHGPGYLDKDKEKIVGFQTDKPFKRSMQIFGGLNMAKAALTTNGFSMDPEVEDFFKKYRKTHNDGVFDVYTPEMRLCRTNHIITGLPDAYGRGRIIGDYRRVALYGIDRLIEDKEYQKSITEGEMTDHVIRLREELSEQIKALKEMKVMAASYGCDISKPASNVQEAIQATYFGYLSAVKEQNGAAMSLGRTSTFLDIYAERDMKSGKFTEEQIQEFVDHFVMKLRLVKFARTPEYNALFAGDPTWVTESIGGIGIDGRHMVTKMSFRFLNTLNNLGTAPEPNMTVLWSTRLPIGWKRFCAKMSIKSSSFQYENDDLMRVTHGDDYAIACCVSSMRVGKEMQFFGARANLAKCLLYALNGGVDECTGVQVGPKYRPYEEDVLDYDKVLDRYTDMMEWLAGAYVNTLNVIHYMHDKYCYERSQMALHDRDVKRYFATGIAGLSVVADSLSAIKYAKVTVKRSDVEITKKVKNPQTAKSEIKVIGVAKDVITGFDIEGDFPKYGNNDDRVDEIAVEIVKRFMAMIRKHHTYRDGVPTTSILTITSNVTYGKNTGSTPDGRIAGQPFAPGANPMHGRDKNGAIASLSSVAKLPFNEAQDGISNTFTIIPGALGKDDVIVGDLSDILNK